MGNGGSSLGRAVAVTVAILVASVHAETPTEPPPAYVYHASPRAFAARMSQGWRWRGLDGPRVAMPDGSISTDAPCNWAMFASGHATQLSVCFRSGVYRFDGSRWRKTRGDVPNLSKAIDFEASDEWYALLLEDELVTVDASGKRRTLLTDLESGACDLLRTATGEIVLRRGDASCRVERARCIPLATTARARDESPHRAPRAAIGKMLLTAARPGSRCADLTVRSLDPERTDRAAYPIRVPILDGRPIKSLASIGSHIVVITADGRLWVGNVVWERWREFNESTIDRLGAVHALAKRGQTMLLGTASGLYILDGNEVRAFDAPPPEAIGCPVTAVGVDAHDRVWIGGPEIRGALCLSGDRRGRCRNHDGPRAGRVHRIRRGRRDSLWFAMETDGDGAPLMRLGACDRWSRHGAASGLDCTAVYDVLDASDGTTYAATDRGLMRRGADGRWRAVPLAKHHHDAAPRRLTEYRPSPNAAPEVWVGFGASWPGIQAVRNDRGVVVSTDVAVGDFAPGDNDLWIASPQGVFLYRAGFFTDITGEPGVPRYCVGTVLRESKNRVWLGSARHGLVRHAPSTDCVPVALRAKHRHDAESGETMISWDMATRWHLTPPALMRYRWRVDHRSWSLPTTALAATFKKLAPGRHWIEIQPVDLSGVLHEPHVIPFDVPSRSWSGWPLIAGASGLFMTLAFLGLQSRRQRRAARARNREVAEGLRETEHLRHLGLLAGGIAHDLNNVLVGVLGNAALIRRQSPDPKTTTLAAGIEAAGERAADLCRQLLAYAGKGKQSIAAIDLSATVGEMLTLVKASLSGKVRLITNLADHPPSIAGDATQVRQTILNLVINAADALGDDGGEIELTTAVEDVPAGGFANARLGAGASAGRYVRLDVRDSGVGMDRETLDQVFDPFFSTKGPARGLGLLAVPKILESHRGVLDVSSRVGAGTTFSVYFPVGSAARTEWHRMPAAVGDVGGGTVLVIEDRALVRAASRALLEHLGFDVITAENGSVGIARCDENADRLRAVLLDMNMPLVSGMTVFKTLRRRYPELPIVLSSGYEGEDAIADLDAHSDFLHKPYTAERLAAVLAALLNHQPA